MSRIAPIVLNSFRTCYTSLTSLRPHPLLSRVGHTALHALSILAHAIAKKGDQLKDRGINLLPCSLASRLDPRRTLIDTLLTIPSSERVDVITHALRLIAPHLTPEAQAQFIAIITTHSDCKELFLNLLPSINHEMHAEEHLELIRTLAHLSQQERGMLIERLLSVPSQEMASALAGYTQERYSTGAENLLQMTQGLNTYARHMVLDAIATLQFIHKQDVIHHALQLMTPKMSAEARCALLKEIATVPEEEIAPLITLALRIQDEGMQEEQQLRILSILIQIPAQDRESVVASVLEMMDDEMQTEQRINLIVQLANIPPSEREEFTTLTLQMLHGKTDIWKRMEIISKMAVMPAHERALFVTLVMQMSISIMDGNDRWWMIGGIDNIDVCDRKDVITHALQLLHPKTHVYERFATLRAIAKLPPQERDRFVADQKRVR